MEEIQEKEKVTIHNLFWYFLVFSVFGLILETIYCYLTTGVLESRKGFIWGPFCPVYGVCGAVLIFILDKFKCKNLINLFTFGFIFGSIAEYILSFGLEAIYGIRFWNYNYLQYNLNGRISFTFSVYWGILAVILIKFVKPFIDKLVDKINPYKRKIVELGVSFFLVMDCLTTIWAIQVYQNRVVYGLEYKANSNNLVLQLRENIENNYFTNERMSRIFPNLRVKNEDGEEVWIKTLINEDIDKEKGSSKQ